MNELGCKLKLKYELYFHYHLALGVEPTARIRMSYSISSSQSSGDLGFLFLLQLCRNTVSVVCVSGLCSIVRMLCISGHPSVSAVKGQGRSASTGNVAKK